MIHILNRRADTHPDFCEDAFFHTEVDGWVIAAVFDGCSSGFQSHYASQLYSYALRSVLRDNWTSFYQLMNITHITPSRALDSIVSMMWHKLQAAITTLNLEELEVLSTIVLSLYHVRSKLLYIKYIGDGSHWVGGKCIRMDPGVENAPIYLSRLTEEQASIDSIAKLFKTYKYENVKFYSICTDGIDAIHHPTKPWMDVMEYLLENNYLWNSSKMLPRKMNILSKEGMVLNDDLTIIRYTNEIV